MLIVSSQDSEMINAPLTLVSSNNISIKWINVTRDPRTKGQDINSVRIVKCCEQKIELVW